MGCAHRHQSGFTLLEILVAVSILGIAVVAVLNAFGTGLRAAAAARDHAAGLQVADNVMNELLMKSTIEEGNLSGQSEDGRFSWSADIAELGPEDVEEGTALAAILEDQPDLTVSTGPAPAAPATQPRRGSMGIYRIHLVVSWTVSGGRTKQLQLDTLRTTWEE